MSESYDLDRLLSLAALFNGPFSLDLLVGLIQDKPTKILEALEEGRQKGLLIGTGPGVFSFADTDKKQASEDQLDQEEKEHLHRRIADFLIKDIPDEDLRAQIAAHHLLRITNDVEKCNLLARAGDLRLKSFHMEEALRCYNKVLEDLSKVVGEEADSLYAETAIRYSRLSMAKYDTQNVLKILEEAMVRAERSNAYPYLPLLKMHFAKNEWLSGREKSAFRHFEESLSTVTAIDNPKLLRSTTAFRIFFLYWQGRFKEIIRVYEKSVPDVERFPQGSFPLLASMMVGYCYALCGQITQGLGMIDAIKSYCQERGDRYIFIYAQNATAGILIDIGRVDEGIQLLESALEEASRGHNDWIWLTGKVALALAYYYKKDYKRAMASFYGYLEQCKQVNITLRFPALLELYWAMERGEIPQIPDLTITREIRKGITSEDVFSKGIAYRFQALVQKKKGLPHERIITSLQFSLKFLEESGHQIELARTCLELARQYLLVGENDKAAENAQKGYKVISSVNRGLFPDDLKFLIAKPLQNRELLTEILHSGQEAVTIRDYKELVQHIISTVNRITGAERGAIFLLDKEVDPPKIQLRASKGLTYEDVNHPDFSSSMKMVEGVVQTGKGSIEQNISAKNAGDKAIRSRICVPLILRNSIVGVLYNDNRVLDSAFKVSHLELLAYFAAQAAIALDNARAYQELQTRTERLKEKELYYKEQQFENLPYEGIVGDSLIMQRLLSLVNHVARTDATVLLLGETGVGKELLASAIHYKSLRSKGPFIRVNINALPESLIPSELFGHEKGAFTGAIRRRIGRFELADRGSLFLDEIADLNRDIQVRLLRVIESKAFERIGGDETLHSDFRLIAASNRDLEKEVKAGNFRADLFYRLNVFPICVPPLRERREDIPLLAHYFLNIHSTKMRKRFEKIDDEEMDKLLHYDWPGNVRELENVIERGVILSSGTTFIVPELISMPSEHIVPRDGDTLQEVNRRHILTVLEKTKWKVRGEGGAAKFLDINPTTLEYKMKKLGIRRPY